MNKKKLPPAKKPAKSRTASRRCAVSPGSGPLAPDEQEVLSVYRSLRDDPDLDQPFIEDIQSSVDLPNDRTLTLTICKPSQPAELGDDDQDPRREDDDE